MCAYNPLNPNGQALMANSQPVVIASNQTPVSVTGLVGSSIIGIVPVQLSNSSIIAVPVGSIVAVVQGSVASAQIGIQISSISGTVTVASIVGTYAEDAAHTSGDAGLFVFGVRNETMASITSADLDYSPHIVGAAGEMIVANAPLTKWVQGKASLFTGIIQPVIAAQGSSIFTYITGVQVANASANNAYITFYGATDSVVGFTVAPANGGSNIVLPNAWKSNANGAFSASVSGVASVFLAAEGFISKT